MGGAFKSRDKGGIAGGSRGRCGDSQGVLWVSKEAEGFQ